MIFLLDAGFKPAESTYEGFTRRIRANIGRTGFHINCDDEGEERIKLGVMTDNGGTRGLVAAFWFNYHWNDQDKVLITQDDWASLDDFDIMDLAKMIQWSMRPGSRTHIVFDDDQNRDMIGYAIAKHEIISTHAEMVLDTEDTLVSQWIRKCPYKDPIQKPEKKFRRKLNINWEK